MTYKPNTLGFWMETRCFPQSLSCPLRAFNIGLFFFFFSMLFSCEELQQRLPTSLNMHVVFLIFIYL